MKALNLLFIAFLPLVTSCSNGILSPEPGEANRIEQTCTHKHYSHKIDGKPVKTTPDGTEICTGKRGPWGWPIMVNIDTIPNAMHISQCKETNKQWRYPDGVECTPWKSSSPSSGYSLDNNTVTTTKPSSRSRNVTPGGHTMRGYTGTYGAPGTIYHGPRGGNFTVTPSGSRSYQ